MNSRARAAIGALALIAALAGPALADDGDFGWLRGTYDGQIGVRYWYGMGSTGKSLYDTAGTTLVSRLTYGGLETQ